MTRFVEVFRGEGPSVLGIVVAEVEFGLSLR
jgi:hypothetical protein